MSVRLKAIELAELLGVAQATVSGAAINDHLCGGYPVAEWADKNIRGRILGYDVPDEIYHRLATGKIQTKSGDGESEESEKELRDKLHGKFYMMVVDRTLEEIEEVEEEVLERFGSDSMAYEEFKRAKKGDRLLREVEEMLSIAEDESE